MEDKAKLNKAKATEADFDRLQEKLDDVGTELATLKQQAEHLLDEAQSNPTVIVSFDKD